MTNYCGGGGALDVWTKQEGCAFGSCVCYGVLDACNRDDGGSCQVYGNETVCTGTCDLNAAGYTLIALAFLFLVTIPVVSSTYNHRHEIKLAIREFFASSGVSEDAMAQKEATRKSLEIDEVQLQIGEKEESRYFDMTEFLHAPMGFLGEERQFNLALETASKSSIFATFLGTTMIFFMCVVFAVTQLKLSYQSHQINADACAMTTVHDYEQDFSCNISIQMYNSSTSRTRVSFQADFARTVSKISLSAVFQHTNLSITAANRPQLHFNYAVHVSTTNSVVIEDLRSFVHVPCVCYGNEECSHADCDETTLIHIRRTSDGTPLEYFEDSFYFFDIFTHFPDNNAHTLKEYNLYLWKNELEVVAFGIQIFVSVVSIIIFIVWMRVLLTLKDELSQWLPTQLWTCILLILNIMATNPINVLYSRYGKKFDWWSDIQNTARFLTWTGYLVILLMMLDSQGRRRLSYRFYWLKLLWASIVVMIRIFVQYSADPYYTLLIDRMLSVGVFLVFGYIAGHVDRKLKKKHYTRTRMQQLTFRVISLLCYMLNIILVLESFSDYSVNKVATFMPEYERYPWISTLLMFEVVVVVIFLIFLPAQETRKLDAHVAYTIRMGHQVKYPSFVPHDSMISPADEANGVKANHKWDLVRAALTQKAVEYWKPHRLFCLETACLLFNFSRLTYAINPKECLQIEDWELDGEITDESTDTMVLILREAHTIAVAFRGTVSRNNVQTDLKIRLTELIFSNEESLQRENNGKVHTGFLRCYQQLRPFILRRVQELLDLMGGPSQVQLYCTGHSLGGALATLCAVDLQQSLHTDVAMYNFGCPRVGNHDFARYYNHRVPCSFRIVNDGDLVVGSPKRELIGCCPGGGTNGPSKYKHIGHDILLDRRGHGDLLLTPNVIEKVLIAKMKTDPKSHTMQAYKHRLERCLHLALQVGYRAEQHPLKKKTTTATTTRRTLSSPLGNARSHIRRSHTPRTSYLIRRWLLGDGRLRHAANEAETGTGPAKTEDGRDGGRLASPPLGV